MIIRILQGLVEVRRATLMIIRQNPFSTCTQHQSDLFPLQVHLNALAAECFYPLQAPRSYPRNAIFQLANCMLKPCSHTFPSCTHLTEYWGD